MQRIEPAPLGLSLAVAAIAGLTLVAPPGASALWKPGLALLSLGALCFLAKRRATEGRHQDLLRAGAWLGLSLGAAALLARDGALLGSPFENVHAMFVGIPNHLAWVLLAAAGLRLERAPHDSRARQLWTGATLWVGATFFMPLFEGVDRSIPLIRLLDQIPWLALPLIAAFILAGLRILPWLTPLESRGAERRARLVLLVPILLGVTQFVELCTSDWTQAGLVGALALAVALVLIALLGAETLDELAGRDEPLVSTTWLDFGVVGVAIGLFLLLKTHGMGPSNTDENIYFYMAARLGDGLWPYVDYFFAHPPLHTLLPGALFAITGFDLTLAKAIAPAACAVGAVALWSMTRAHLGRLPAAVALVAFLFAAEVLKASTNMTGVNLTVMWILLGLRAWSLEQPRRAGLFFGCALSTGIYAAAAVCAALALATLRQRRFALELLASVVAVFGLVNLVGWIAAPEAFIEGVYRYHGLKAADASGQVAIFGGAMNPVSAVAHNVGVLLEGKPFTKELFYHAHLWLGAALVPLVAVARAAWSGRPRQELRALVPDKLWAGGSQGMALLLWWVSISVFIQFALFREVYSFYFMLIYPLLAISLGWASVAIVRLACSSVARSWPVSRAVGRLGAGCVLLTLLLSWESIAFQAQASGFPKELERAGERNVYAWKAAPAVPSLSPVVEALFWADHRTRGHMERGYRHYLWNKKRAVSSLPEIVSFVRDRGTPEDTIAGSSTLAPLVALASGRRLAADEADTNSKRFKTGILEESAYWDAICRDRVRFIVSTPKSFFTRRRMSAHPTLRRWFRPAKYFEDQEIRYGGPYPIQLYERIQEAPIDGRVCRWEAPRR